MCTAPAGTITELQARAAALTFRTHFKSAPGRRAAAVRFSFFP